MRSHEAGKRKRQAAILWMGGLLLFVASLLEAPLFAASDLDIKRDDEKTVYTIGPSERGRREEDMQKDRAWDMLRNMGVIMDKRQGQTTKRQGAQPATGK
jgi:hypothetical protein